MSAVAGIAPGGSSESICVTIDDGCIPGLSFDGKEGLRGTLDPFRLTADGNGGRRSNGDVRPPKDGRRPGSDGARPLTMPRLAAVLAGSEWAVNLDVVPTDAVDPVGDEERVVSALELGTGVFDRRCDMVPIVVDELIRYCWLEISDRTDSVDGARGLGFTPIEERGEGDRFSSITFRGVTGELVEPVDEGDGMGGNG